MKKISPTLVILLIAISGLSVYYFYPETKIKKGQKVDKIIISKTEHKLHLYYKDTEVAEYTVSLSRNGLGKKTKLGDNLTPEGLFRGKKRTQTKYHKAIGVGNWGDCCNVLIHGLGKQYGVFRKFHRFRDWTKGCIALTNDEIDEIYGAIDNDLIIEIKP